MITDEQLRALEAQVAALEAQVAALKHQMEHQMAVLRARVQQILDSEAFGRHWPI